MADSSPMMRLALAISRLSLEASVRSAPARIFVDYLTNSRRNSRRPQSALLRETRVALLREGSRRRQLEAELQAAEVRFRSVTQSLGDAIITAGNDGRIVFWNQAAEKIFGYREEEALGLPFTVVLPERFRDLHRAEMERRIGNTVELTGLSKGGDEFPIRLTVSFWKGIDGVFYTGIIRDETSRVQIEEMARRQRDELRLFFDFVPAIICFKDTENRILRVNRQLAESVGRTIEEVEGKASEEIYGDDDAAKYYRDDLEVIHSGVPKLGIIETFRDGQGREVWVQADKAPVRDKDGKVIGVVAMVQDITERQAAQAELRWKTAFLEAQVNSSTDGILVVDAKRRRILQNQRLADLYRIPPEIAADADYGKQLDWAKRMTKNPEPFSQRVDYLYDHPGEIGRDEIELKDGTTMDRYSSPLIGKDGENYGRIWIFRDVTESKRAEKALRESEERFRGAFENSAIGMALVSLEGGWIRVNDALCKIVGRTEDELLCCTFQDITHPEDLDTDLSNVRAMLAGEVDHYQMEKRYFHQSGRVVWILLAATLVRDLDGRPVHFVSQIQDITARHEAGQRLQASLEEKEVLLREVHHRVKNNLQVITSLLQLQSSYLHDPRDATIFKDCQARIHAMGLVHDRLYRSGNFATIDFSAHLQELIALITRGQSAAPERIRVEVKSDPVEVNLDTAIPLGLITAELITNAYKHAFVDRAGGLISVSLACDAERQLILIVEDDGVGFPVGFEPEKARSLGLRLVRALTGQLRGKLSIASTSGRHRLQLICPLVSS